MSTAIAGCTVEAMNLKPVQKGLLALAALVALVGLASGMTLLAFGAVAIVAAALGV